MAHVPGMDPVPSGVRPTPLTPDEEVRFQLAMSEWVSQEVAAKGSVRVPADTPEQLRRFQEVTRRAGEILQQPVISYANSRDITITVNRDGEPPELTG